MIQLKEIFHADNGSPKIYKSVAQLLMDLGVAKLHSRPHVSGDNPYPEAQVKTMQYRPGYLSALAAWRVRGLGPASISAELSQTH